MTTVSTYGTELTLEHHLKSVFDRNVEEILRGYTQESILFLPQGPIRGLGALEEFYIGFLDSRPDHFSELFRTIRKEFDGDIAYLVWSAGRAIPFATDTFVIQDGKILKHTFAAYMGR
jgi:predicted SnoaL-like aldol condensation-catalyzing enzyme